MKARLALLSVLVAAVAAGLSLPVSAAFRSGAATHAAASMKGTPTVE